MTKTVFWKSDYQIDDTTTVSKDVERLQIRDVCMKQVMKTEDARKVYKDRDWCLNLTAFPFSDSV